MATQFPTTITPKAGDRRAVLAFVGTVAAIVGVPVAFSAYAQSRPMANAICETARDHLWAEPVEVDVRTCRVVGVEVSRSVTPVLVHGSL